MNSARRHFRRFLRWLGKLMLWGLTRSHITGVEKFPVAGPYIVAGNHRGIMEVALMVVAAPTEIEIIGAGDIPLDRRYRYFARMYGYIPYRRGQLDRSALREAQRVLVRGGVVGIFPEGGIWQTTRSSAHRGVSWLSFTTGAPVIPVGFAGVAEAIHKMVTLQYPRLEGHVGDQITVDARDDSLARKAQMAQFAETVLDRIEDLIPDWDRSLHDRIEHQEYELTMELKSPEERSPRRVDQHIYRPELLAKLFHFPVIINALYFNLKRHAVAPFRRPNRFHSVGKIGHAARVLLGYSRITNTGFFSYRLGETEAAEIDRTLVTLCRFCGQLERWEPSAELRFVPIYRFRRIGDETAHERRKPRYSRRL